MNERMKSEPVMCHYVTKIERQRQRDRNQHAAVARKSFDIYLDDKS